LSSAILYIGIVAIWAFVLVPKWLRRDHALPDGEADAASDASSDAASSTAARARSRRDELVHADEDDIGQDRFGEQTPVAMTPRSRVLAARRRLLSMLLTLTFGAIACHLLKFVPWWAVIPPAGMLGFYVLLLRAAAQADAERVRRQAATAARAPAARRNAEVAAVRDPALPSEPIADVIDISAKMGDQLYDQYADAAIRAVGD
jgi:hypothetical protein